MRRSVCAAIGRAVRRASCAARIGRPAPRAARRAALAAVEARCDAQRRANEALAALAAPLRRVVERVCLYEEGLEALERAEGWPARSGKIALKLGLAQLAAQRWR